MEIKEAVFKVIIKFLSKELKKKVRIVSGFKSREKIIGLSN